MKARILIIEDEPEIGELIGLYLKNDGIDFDLFESGEKGLEAFRKGEYDLLVLDINLPGIDGFEVLNIVRRESNIPIVVVSARQSDEDKVLALGIGADDFVSKPFSPRVLVARVRAHLRRYSRINAKTADEENINFGPYSINIEAYLFKKDNKRIALPPREFEVLAYLIENAGRALNLEDIYIKIWGNQYGDLSTVAVHIQRLRRKIENDPSNPEYIETVHGIGYRFNKDKLEK